MYLRRPSLQLLIPVALDPSELLEHIPSLGPISEERTLEVRRSEGSPSLFDTEFSKWPEPLILLLFQDVQPDATQNGATADWINGFLDHLSDLESLTQTAGVPLIPSQPGRWLP